MEPARKKVAFHTLGCKLNFAETSTISRSFPEDQFEKVRPGSIADIHVINTCSVTGIADRKCRQVIKRCIKESPGSVIAVMGCYAQLNPGEISSIPGVDLVLGSNEKFDAVAFIERIEKKKTAEIHSNGLAATDLFHPSFSIGDRTRSFLKVQDGCDYRCSYCTIPVARGRSRNQDIPSLILEAEKIACRGIKEIVLTGVNIGDFGKSTGDSFASLLKELVRVEGIERYRISSIEPNLITDEIIGMAAECKKILPHFHIPLQSGSDKVLRLMKRRYRTDQFGERINLIRKYLPMAGIGADVIVGFPGETDNDFEDTMSFLKEIPLSYLHVFNFSERPGTAAEKMAGKVPFSTRESRSRKLIELSEIKHLAFLEQNLNRSDEILFEHTRTDGLITGFTGNYIRAEYPWKSSLAGTIKTGRLTGISGTGRMTVELID
ncbi:MAG TPA: tRNA (N(6)-L-threonylcarbamoyladenosine(37)-C(2))-methylthiotransferase MtaB [Bacteroidales bacterium]|nr:tRNA (N(6)-L-threonylcarbamoyladenosine(37)-C(2))-methylthiotransferase MtaB [Bacteroidales bacterium]HBZ22420.1 tRNA (N(6)-L-threonylcarbamoyladenosine(37)-C(2))-methylthiotransferase MtaB [Bacteroidales bacterium]